MTILKGIAVRKLIGTGWFGIRWRYVEIKCQLDATDEFLLQILLLAQNVSGTIMPIIRSSRVLYKSLLPVVFGA
jgi:hypothetical protein